MTAVEIEIVIILKITKENSKEKFLKDISTRNL